jgi:hypothetical protein
VRGLRGKRVAHVAEEEEIRLLDRHSLFLAFRLWERGVFAKVTSRATC